MLKQAVINNLTTFSEANLQFASGLNVIIGENGCGKSHLLKAIYALMSVIAQEGLKANSATPTKALLQRSYANKLISVFRPESLGRLARRQQGRARCEISLYFDDDALNSSISLATQSKSEVQIECSPSKWLTKAPVFIPTKEVLSSYHWMPALYRTTQVDIEENLIDLCDLLGALALKGKREEKVKELVAPIETALGGKVILDPNGRFYLQVAGSGKMEMSLVAEGLRKLAMIARLITTGSLLDKGYLIWDEPESNLNPKLIKLSAFVILHLCNNGIQVFIASHSLFLLRELEVLSQDKTFQNIPQRYFALRTENGETHVEQGNTVEDLQTLVLLDEELSQSDRFMAAGE